MSPRRLGPTGRTSGIVPQDEEEGPIQGKLRRCHAGHEHGGWGEIGVRGAGLGRGDPHLPPLTTQVSRFPRALTRASGRLGATLHDLKLDLVQSLGHEQRLIDCRRELGGQIREGTGVAGWGGQGSLTGQAGEVGSMGVKDVTNAQSAQGGAQVTLGLQRESVGGRVIREPRGVGSSPLPS